MKKSFALLLVSAFTMGCWTPDTEIVPITDYRLEIGAVLSESGRDTLSMDERGYYHLTLDRSKWQTIRRVTGRITVNGVEPFPSQKVEWESNLYWYIQPGDTVLASVVRTYVNIYTGKLTQIVYPPFISNTESVVPTINCCSYNGANGVVNTMIAPVITMVGDTLIVQAFHSESGRVSNAKIVLE